MEKKECVKFNKSGRNVDKSFEKMNSMIETVLAKNEVIKINSWRIKKWLKKSIDHELKNTLYDFYIYIDITNKEYPYQYKQITMTIYNEIDCKLVIQYDVNIGLTKKVFNIKPFEEALESIKDFRNENGYLSDTDFLMTLSKTEEKIINNFDKILSSYCIINGEPNDEVIDILNNKFDIYIHSGETDSFGWLTGVIDLPNDQHYCFG